MNVTVFADWGIFSEDHPHFHEQQGMFSSGQVSRRQSSRSALGNLFFPLYDGGCNNYNHRASDCSPWGGDGLSMCDDRPTTR